MLKTPQTTYTTEHICAKIYFLFLYLHYLQSYFGNCIFTSTLFLLHRDICSDCVKQWNEVMQKVLLSWSAANNV